MSFSHNKLLSFLLLSGLIVLSGCATAPSKTTKTTKTVGSAQPRGQGIYHKVRPGETLWRIAKTYEVSLDEILMTNRIPNVAQIEKDQLIFIPEADSVRTVVLQTDLKDNDFIWPVRGIVVSYFGDQRGSSDNRGIDIRVEQGGQVTAARSGKVVLADYLNGYEHTVILSHQDGFYSVYSQNAQLLVQLNDVVEQGKPIAELGKKSDGALLHFEIRKNARAENPLFYLPKS